MQLSLVVPCYNEQDNIKPFFKACQDAFDGKIDSYEIVFVDDGSKDNTWEELKSTYKSNSNIKIIRFSRNFGKESAMYAGLEKAEGEYVAIIDADLQQPPLLVGEMVEFLEKNGDYDSVAAYQSNRHESRVLGFFKNAFYKFINKICEVKLYPGASDFRVFRSSVVCAVLNMKENIRFSKGIFAWVGFRTQYIPYEAEKRYSGDSTWSFVKLFRYAFEGIIAFTVKPLKAGIYAGVVLSAVSAVCLIVAFLKRFAFSLEVSRTAFFAAALFFVLGIQLVFLGIIGIYLAKIYTESKNRPIYIAKEYLK